MMEINLPQPGTETHAHWFVEIADACRRMTDLNRPRKATRVGDLYLDFEIKQAPWESEFPAQIKSRGSIPVTVNM